MDSDFDFLKARLEELKRNDPPTGRMKHITTSYALEEPTHLVELEDGSPRWITDSLFKTLQKPTKEEDDGI